MRRLNRVTIEVIEECNVGKAQLDSKWLANSIGLSQISTYYIATAVTELANNLLFHTIKGGLITLTSLEKRNRIGIEIVAEDEGPGIPDIKLAMEDGYTTNGGLGGGLPGVARLTDELEITSSPENGTRIVARKWQIYK